MRTVTINVADVGINAEPGDHLIFSSPVTRLNAGETGLTSTAPTTVYLTDGQGSIGLDEGPLQVQFRCRGLRDTGPFYFTLPAGTGSMALSALLNNALTHTLPAKFLHTQQMPTVDQQLVPKAYVDAQMAALNTHIAALTARLEALEGTS